MTKPVYTHEQFAAMLQTPAPALKGALLGYLAESEHGNWEGVPPRDIAAIRRFVADFAIWVQNGGAELQGPCTFGAGLHWDGK